MRFQGVAHTIIENCTFSNISYLRAKDIEKGIMSPPYPIISIGEPDPFQLIAVRSAPRSIVMRNVKVLDSNGTSLFTVYLPCNKVSSINSTCLEDSRLLSKTVLF